MSRTKLTTFVALFALFAVGSRSAATHPSGMRALQLEAANSPVRPGSKTTYLDLLRKLLPDLLDSKDEGDADAHRSVPFRNMDDQRKSAVLEGDIKIERFELRWINNEGRRLLLLLVDLSAEDANEGTSFAGEASLLAAFSVEPNVELLDVIDIKTDRFTGFCDDQPLLHLNAQNDAFAVYSTHSNAGEAYIILDLMFINKGRFEVIADLFLLDTQGCGATFTETPFFRALPAAGRKHANVVMKVQVRKDADPEECEHRSRGYIRYYQAVYSWNPSKARYETNSHQLDRLNRFNRL